MKAVLTNRFIQSRYTGLDLYRARRKIMQDFPGLEEEKIELRYVESPYPQFTVLKSGYNSSKGVIELEASSNNPIRHLPSNYQNNDFLRGFLMIFQHIRNDTSIILDNMHEYFRPMESPPSFLPVLAGWFGIHLDTLGGEKEARRFLQYAIPLYRYRGTALGLCAHLAIVCGVVPEIIEGKTPYASMVIQEGAEVAVDLLEADVLENSFTVHFPVLRGQFDDTLVRRLSLIVRREKPVHTKAYISFLEPKRKPRKVTVIDQTTTMGFDNDGISI